MVAIISKSPKETKSIGECVGRVLRQDDVLALSGELGAGKTVLVQGLAEGLEVQDAPSSPTFVIAAEYLGKMPLYHIDLYRLSEAAEIRDLGIDEYFEKGGVTVIEWAERCKDILPRGAIYVNIDVLGESERKISFSGSDISRVKSALENFKKDEK